MRLQNKFKKFQKLSSTFKEFPTKISKFHSTKWKKIQQIVLKSSKKGLLNSTKKLLATRKWIFYKSKYAEGVKTKKYFDCLYDRAFSILFYKNLKFLNKKLNKMLEFAIYFIKPEYRVDIFFWRLNYFFSLYEARRYINNKLIKVNNKNIHPNYFLKKGDIITFDYTPYYEKSNYKNILFQKINNNKFNTFIEIDYYTNTVIILKNYNELNEKEMVFFVSHFLDIAKFKTFIE